MALTCTQMDVLISFYIDGELSASLKKQVEEHLNLCASCRTKFNIINSMVTDIKSTFEKPKSYNENYHTLTTNSQNERYKFFKAKLSQYVDNELLPEDNVKIKKIIISNPDAKNSLEQIYSLDKLIKQSFGKAQDNLPKDFSKSVLKQILPHKSSYSLPLYIKFISGSIISIALIILAAIYINSNFY